MDETAAPDDPRVLAVQELFRNLERLLPRVRQEGWAPAATQSALRTTHAAFTDVLGKSPEALRLACRPYSLLSLGQSVWEPSAPLDAIPYNLFDCGIRVFQFKPGLSMEELQSVLQLFLVDPGRDLPPEDDLAAALWDLGLLNVEYEATESFAHGDAAEREGFYHETDELERLAKERASRLEARAMSVSTDSAVLNATRERSPLALDEAMRSALAPALALSPDQWGERHVWVLAEALIDTDRRGDAKLVLSAMRRSTGVLIAAGRLAEALASHAAVRERLAQALPKQEADRLTMALTDEMFGGETLTVALAKLALQPSLCPQFAPVLKTISHRELHFVFAAMKKPLPDPLVPLLVSYLDKAIPHAEEEELSQSLGELDPSCLAAVLGSMKRGGTQATRRVMADLAQSKTRACGLKPESSALRPQRPCRRN